MDMNLMLSDLTLQLRFDNAECHPWNPFYSVLPSGPTSSIAGVHIGPPGLTSSLPMATSLQLGVSIWRKANWMTKTVDLGAQTEAARLRNEPQGFYSWCALLPVLLSCFDHSVPKRAATCWCDPASQWKCPAVAGTRGRSQLPPHLRTMLRQQLSSSWN
ncbi:hypothetical protein NW762_012969 [Fusarium torreyae]|uniref:Uncharacterized protein n=1 Tax=Fusarium torreyae TaxID=1237075 RepID=A0A9W8VAS3_9HYPO|nr:hypothetical protein NW762_012969 [Fusarium torreyae]